MSRNYGQEAIGDITELLAYSKYNFRFLGFANLGLEKKSPETTNTPQETTQYLVLYRDKWKVR